mmetsp:Transcript_15962/g.17722  ORF Transcript_15962/g.17722 Transcript_15962/m.17722 type:complete len:264 (+) Transcript_15962:31-822(+)
MPIIYALVARQTTILADHAFKQGNYTTVVQRILEKIPPQDGKMSYVFERHYFHYIVDDSIIYMCMADEGFGRRIPFAFLDDIKSRFASTYGGRGHTAHAYEMNADFARVLEKQMDYFSNNQNADRIRSVKGKINEVNKILVQNIEKVLERGESIELLVDATERLNTGSLNFKKKSTALKKAMWWKNIKILIILGVVAVVVIYIIIAIICKGPFFPGCIKKSNSTPPAPVAPPTAPTPAPTVPPTVAPTAAPVAPVAPTAAAPV